MKLPNSKNAYISSSKLLDIMTALRSGNGCPWDKEQTAESLKPFLVEETYEVLEALDEGDPKKIKEVITSPHGVKYLIEGSIQTPTGTYIKLRTIWIIDSGQDYPRFVTAYPL
ncbi:MAG: hypothetical protein M1147_04375 [Nitrospirae bacterium]|nr:hypothetical protein [Nitrospirota bacterium]